MPLTLMFDPDTVGIVCNASWAAVSGQMVTSGSGDLFIYRFNPNQAPEQFDFDDDTFKASGVTTPSKTMAHQEIDGQDTGQFITTVTDLSGFSGSEHIIFQAMHSLGNPEQHEVNLQVPAFSLSRRATNNEIAILSISEKNPDSFTALGAVPAEFTFTGAFANVTAVDGVFHGGAAVATPFIDFFYQFDLGALQVGLEITVVAQFTGKTGQTARQIGLSVFNWETGNWGLKAIVNHDDLLSTYTLPLSGAETDDGTGAFTVADGTVRIRCSGGTQAATDTIDFDFLQIRFEARDGGISEVADAVRGNMLEAVYPDGVFIDTVNGTPGAALPDVGTRVVPTTNLNDAVILSNQLLNRELTLKSGVVGNFIIDRDLPGVIFKTTANTVEFDQTPNPNITDGRFFGGTYTGDYTTTATSEVSVIFSNAVIGTLLRELGGSGAAFNFCKLANSGLIAFLCTTTGSYVFQDCGVLSANDDSAIIGLGSQPGVLLRIDNFTGDLEIFNGVSDTIVTVDGLSGKLIINANCDDAMVVTISGVAELDDQRTGPVAIGQVARLDTASINTALSAAHGAGSWDVTGLAQEATAQSILGRVDVATSTRAAQGTADTILARTDVATSTRATQVSVDALAVNLDVAVSTRSSHSAADVDTTLSGTHGTGAWTSADVSALALQANVLTIESRVDVATSTRSSHSAADVDTVLVAAHGGGAWTSADTSALALEATSQSILDDTAQIDTRVDVTLSTRALETTAQSILTNTDAKTSTRALETTAQSILTNADVKTSTRSSHDPVDVAREVITHDMALIEVTPGGSIALHSMYTTIQQQLKSSTLVATDTLTIFATDGTTTIQSLAISTDETAKPFTRIQ